MYIVVAYTEGDIMLLGREKTFENAQQLMVNCITEATGLRGNEIFNGNDMYVIGDTYNIYDNSAYVDYDEFIFWKILKV